MPRPPPPATALIRTGKPIACAAAIASASLPTAPSVPGTTVECTATVAMPISRQARRMRSATSPRFAIRTLRNTGASLEHEERLAVLHGSRVLDEDANDAAGARRADRVHHLHRLDDQECL